MSMGGAAKVIVDKAAEEIATASKGNIAVTWMLLAFNGLGLFYAIHQFSAHSDRLFAQMMPVNSFSSLMMKLERDDQGFEKPQIELWIRQAQNGNQALARVEGTLAAHGKELAEIRKLQGQIVELLEKQQTGRVR